MLVSFSLYGLDLRMSSTTKKSRISFSLLSSHKGKSVDGDVLPSLSSWSSSDSSRLSLDMPLLPPLPSPDRDDVIRVDVSLPCTCECKCDLSYFIKSREQLSARKLLQEFKIKELLLNYFYLFVYLFLKIGATFFFV